jgi:hypothetical protein
MVSAMQWLRRDFRSTCDFHLQGRRNSGKIWNILQKSHPTRPYWSKWSHTLIQPVFKNYTRLAHPHTPLANTSSRVQVTPNRRQLHDWNASVEITLVNPSHTGIRTPVQISANTLYESQPYLLYTYSESKAFEDRTRGPEQTVAQNACRSKNPKHDSSPNIYTIHI